VRSSTASAVTVCCCRSRCWVTAATCRRCRLNPLAWQHALVGLPHPRGLVDGHQLFFSRQECYTR